MASQSNQPNVSLRLHDPAKPGSTVAWTYVVSILGFHLIALLALVPWLFSWTGLVLAVAGLYVFGTLGVNLCYHRLLTHRSFSCSKRLEHFLALLGCCCLQDSPSRWVAIHRLHHQHSDEEPDPHSPLLSFFWGHMGWLFVDQFRVALSLYERYVRDLLQDRFYFKLERKLAWVWVAAAHTALFFLAGLAIGTVSDGSVQAGLQFGASLVVWGVILRTVAVWHITWSVNSLSHVWGYRNYETSDHSTNNWFVALVSNGEGWHNNHHADQRSAAHGHRWWEFDVTYLTIKGLEKLGLVWDVVPIRVKQTPDQEQEQPLRRAA